METFITKLGSRKLWVTVGTLLLFTVFDVPLDQAETIVVGVLAALYVASEAVIDRQRVAAGSEKALGVLLVLFLVPTVTGCGALGDSAPQRVADACPAAAKAMTIDCPRAGVTRCEGKPWEVCPDRPAIEAECDRMIEAALAGCP